MSDLCNACEYVVVGFKHKNKAGYTPTAFFCEQTMEKLATFQVTSSLKTQNEGQPVKREGCSK